MQQQQRISTLERFIRLASKAEPSIQGSGGSDARFNVIQAGAVGLNLDDAEVIQGLTESGWLASCNPPWTHKELTAAIPRIRRDSRRAPGYLLADDDHRPRTTSKPVASVPLTPLKRQGYDPDTLAGKAAQQAAWPTLVPLTGKQIGAIAHLRNCPITGVEILNQCGRLAFDPARPDCFVLDDGRTDGRGHRQYRKFDGSVFPHGKKSNNVKGSAAKGFLSLSHERRLDPDELIFITEGSISLLEAVACQWLCEGRARRWHFLAAHSCNSTFNAEPALLKAIAGRHCRILPDPGKAGTDAARAWRDELRAVGCTVDFATLPDGFQDLKKLLAAGTDGVPAIRALLRYPSARQEGGAA